MQYIRGQSNLDPISGSFGPMSNSNSMQKLTKDVELAQQYIFNNFGFDINLVNFPEAKVETQNESDHSNLVQNSPNKMIRPDSLNIRSQFEIDRFQDQGPDTSPSKHTLGFRRQSE